MPSTVLRLQYVTFRLSQCSSCSIRCSISSVQRTELVHVTICAVTTLCVTQDRGGGVVLLASSHFANGAAGSSSALAHGVVRYSLLDRRHSQVLYYAMLYYAALHNTALYFYATPNCTLLLYTTRALVQRVAAYHLTHYMS
jgi:hypothetical protein